MKLTKQKAFNKVWDHFVTKQSPLSIAKGKMNSCCYRLDHTASCPIRCAVGLFIPDEVYNPKFEGLTVVGLLEEFPEALKNIDENNIYFYSALQNVHDSMIDSSELSLQDKLRYLAKQYKLTVPVAQ